MLWLYITIPLVGIIWIIHRGKDQKEISLLVSLISLGWCILICILSPTSSGGYFILERWTSYLNWGIDSLSQMLIMLTDLIFIISILSSWGKVKEKDENLFYCILLFLHSILI